MTSLEKLLIWHEKYVFLTFPKQIVVNKSFLVGKTNFELKNYCNSTSVAIFLSTRTLKHLYDKRSAVIYFLLLKYLRKLIISPDRIYENGISKRGSYILVKAIKTEILSVILEKDKEKADGAFITTAFKTDEKYLKKFKLLWKRRVASPHRNGLELFKAY